MYLRKVTIENVRSINKFEMEFKEGQEAGWHVIIGDNGSGKTTVLRVLVYCIFQSVIFSINFDLMEPIRKKLDDEKNNILDRVQYLRNENIPVNHIDLFGPLQTHIKERSCLFEIINEQLNGIEKWTLSLDRNLKVHHFMDGPKQGGEAGTNRTFHLYQIIDKGLLIAFGPVRNFSDSKSPTDKFVSDKPRTKRVINLFYDDATFYEIEEWLYDLDYKRLKENEKKDAEAKSGKLLEAIFKLINPQPNANDSLLPYGVKINSFDDNGKLQLIDGYGATVYLTDLSAGYRSVLALVLEILRHMIDQFGVDAVFKEGQDFIDCEGVVLIDEIDAHLHPTWQTRIGQWFTKFFPKIQFIVTTHSPLICRACYKPEVKDQETGEVLEEERYGTIWRLAAPGSSYESGKVEDTLRDSLIFGDILDAYGTDLFGANIERTQESAELLKKYAKLDRLHTFGQITEEQETERQRLQQIFSNNVEAEF